MSSSVPAAPIWTHLCQLIRSVIEPFGAQQVEPAPVQQVWWPSVHTQTPPMPSPFTGATSTRVCAVFDSRLLRPRSCFAATRLWSAPCGSFGAPMRRRCATLSLRSATADHGPSRPITAHHSLSQPITANHGPSRPITAHHSQSQPITAQTGRSWPRTAAKRLCAAPS